MKPKLGGKGGTGGFTKSTHIMGGPKGGVHPQNPTFGTTKGSHKTNGQKVYWKKKKVGSLNNRWSVDKGEKQARARPETTVHTRNKEKKKPKKPKRIPR